MIKIKKNNKNLNTSNNEEFSSSAAIIDEEAYGNYAELLDAKIKDKDVFNIGIIGPYGSGKSSLIKTYIDTKLKRKKDKKKVITISLANFNSNDDFDDEELHDVDENKKSKNSKSVADKKEGTESNKALKDIDSEIEKSILQQFIFNIGKNKLPFSHIDRVGERSNLSIVLYLASFELFLLFTILSTLKYLDKLTNTIFQSLSFEFYLLITLLLFFVFLFLTLNHFQIKRVSIKSIEAEIGENSKTSILNLFIDEIIYFFKMSKKTIVIIEDLDRFDNLDIFSKLREINFLLNNSEILKSKITFVYLIKDTMFKSSLERAKFFDYVITLMTCLNSSNIKKVINKKINGEQILNENFAHYISYYIDDMRLLINTINDYTIYYKVLNLKNENKNNEKLFSLMLYKNKYPLEFAKLQKEKGEIVEFIRQKRESTLSNEEQIKSKILKLEEEYNKLLEAGISSNESFINLLAGIIVSKKNYNRCSYNNMRCSIFDIKNFKDFDKYTEFYVNVGSYSGPMILTKREIEKELGMDLSYFASLVSNNCDSVLDALVEQINQEKTKLEKIKSISLKEYLTNYANENVPLKDFTRFLIINEYLDENYKIFMNVNYVSGKDDYVTENDKYFIRKMLINEKMNYDYKIDNPEIVINEIDDELFTWNYWYNYDLLNYFIINDCSDNQMFKKRNSALTSLKMFESRSNEFYIETINKEAHLALITNSIILENEHNLSKFIISCSKLSTDKKDKYLKKMFFDNNNNISIIKKQDINCCISEYLSNHNNPIDSFFNEEYCAIFIEIFSELNVHFKNFITDDAELIKKYNVQLKQVVDKNLYEINSNNLKFIEFKLFDSTGFCEGAYFSNAATSIKSVNDYLINNLEKYCNIFIHENLLCYDKENEINIILLDKKLTEEFKNNFIEKLNTKLNYNADYLENIIKQIVNKNKLIANWDNAINLNNRFGISYALEFIENNTESLSKEVLNNENIIDLLCRNAHNIEKFKEYSKAFNCKLEKKYYNDEIEASLVKNKKIDFSQESQEKISWYCNNNYVKTISALFETNSNIFNYFNIIIGYESLVFNIISNCSSKEIKDKIISKLVAYNVTPTIDIACDIFNFMLNSKGKNILPTLFEKIICLNDPRMPEKDKIKLINKYSYIIDDEMFKRILINIDSNIQKIFDVTDSQEFDKNEFARYKLEALSRRKMYEYDYNKDKVIVKKVAIKEEVAA